jgi:hypothetical protein
VRGTLGRGDAVQLEHLALGVLDRVANRSGEEAAGAAVDVHHRLLDTLTVPPRPGMLPHRPRLSHAVRVVLRRCVDAGAAHNRPVTLPELLAATLEEHRARTALPLFADPSDATLAEPLVREVDGFPDEPFLRPPQKSAAERAASPFACVATSSGRSGWFASPAAGCTCDWRRPVRSQTTSPPCRRWCCRSRTILSALGRSPRRRA